MKKIIILIGVLGLVCICLFAMSPVSNAEANIEIKDIEFEGPIRGPIETENAITFIIFIFLVPFIFIGFLYSYKTLAIWFRQVIQNNNLCFPYQAKNIKEVLGL